MDYVVAYGWPAIAPRVDIEYWDSTTHTMQVIAQSLAGNRFEFPTSEFNPGALLIYPIWKSDKRKRPYIFPVNDPPIVSTIRWKVRAALNDVQEEDLFDVRYPDTPKWPDSEIDGYIREAISNFNNYFQRDSIIHTTVADRAHDMPPDILNITRVIWYSTQQNDWFDLNKASDRGVQNNMYQTRRRMLALQSWDFEQGALILYGVFEPEDPLDLHVITRFHLPSGPLDPLDIDPEDFETVSIYAQAKAYFRLAGQTAQLDRWKEDGIRTDNPIYKVAVALMRQYEDRIGKRKQIVPLRRYRP
jgi:hypothetical protein